MTVANTVDSSIPLSGRQVAPLDPTENALKAYSLAGTMVDVQEKQRKQKEGQFDRKYLQDHIQNGGDLSTPDGIDKAIKDLGARGASPDMILNLVGHKEKVTDAMFKQQEILSKLQEQHLKEYDEQDTAVGGMVDQLSQQYKATAEAKGQQAADEELSKNKAQMLQWMQTQQVQGKARFSPDMVNNIKSTPGSMLGQLKGAIDYHHKMVTDHLATARAKSLEEAGDIFEDKEGNTYKAFKTGQVMKATNNPEQPWEPSVMPQGAKKLGTAKADGGVEFTPGALNDAAVEFLYNGKEMTRGTPDDKKRVRDLATTLRQNAGLSMGDVLSMRVDAAGRQKAMANLTNLAGAVDAFENNVTKNVETAKTHIAQADLDTPTNMVKLKRWIQSGMGATEGLPDSVARLAIDLRNVAGEYTKLQAGSLGNAPIAEGAVKEMNDLFNAADNPDSLRSKLDEVLVDAHNRSSGIRDAQNRIRGAISGDVAKITGGQTKSAGSPAAAAPADSEQGLILRTELKKAREAVSSAKNDTEKKRAQDDVTSLMRELRAAGVKDPDGAGGGDKPPSGADAKTLIEWYKSHKK